MLLFRCRTGQQQKYPVGRTDQTSWQLIVNLLPQRLASGRHDVNTNAAAGNVFQLVAGREAIDRRPGAAGPNLIWRCLCRTSPQALMRASR
jgi:hypothetical protein